VKKTAGLKNNTLTLKKRTACGKKRFLAHHASFRLLPRGSDSTLFASQQKDQYLDCLLRICSAVPAIPRRTVSDENADRWNK
jgi:hypothetical protein